MNSRLAPERFFWPACLLLCWFSGIVPSAFGQEGNTIEFDRQVRPILVKHCVACHGGVKSAASLSLVSREYALAETDSGEPSILPGDSEGSYLIDRVSDPDDDDRMPPAEHGRRLNPAEVETLRRWIDAGAPWEQWSFSKPRKPSVPKVQQQGDWPRSPLDRFVLARLEAEGLAPSPEASRSAWLRRVSFDLVGLPPTGEEQEAFLTDTSEGAHARVVDRLLVSPHFGERWTSVWLDLARYADTIGYERDPPRDIWPYRDWIIRAFDDDKPYDDFLLEQLAGDLLPDATLEDHLATGFHRNTQTNTEGGTDDEEFRIAAITDRVDTTWQAIGGLTFGCAHCHDHPYDPISQRDYYRFFACFNSTQDCDLVVELPKLDIPKDWSRWQETDAIDRELHTIRQTLFEQGVELASGPNAWRGLEFDVAESTGDTELSLQPVTESINGAAADGTEVIAKGTLSDYSVYTLSAPGSLGRVTALRLDALPKDLEASLRSPTPGFALTHLRMFVVSKEGEEREVFFQTAIGDEAKPFFDPEESLIEKPTGWSAYSTMLRPRWAIFVVDEVTSGQVDLIEGDRLRLVLKHDKKPHGKGAILIRRLRASLTGNLAWQAWMTDDARRSQLARKDELENQRAAIPSTETLVMAERPTEHFRPSHVFIRGNWLVKGEPVQPGIPQVFGQMGESNPSEPPRLQLARWIASADNPLTARVWVNRIWDAMFGHGLVTTLDEFGSTGPLPTHPQLLDHLTTRFQGEWSWQLKPLLRELVLSATYRQDARLSEELRLRDPNNELLARGPRNRLRSEMVRDQALCLSGNFNPERYGPPVMPYQPEGVWQSIYSTVEWEAAEDESRFRRAVYTYWKRTAAYPSMIAFDMSSRETCIASRPTTNTPLQALVTLNDPAFVELAEGFARRILSQEGETPAEQVAWAVLEATGQEPPAASLDVLLKLHSQALASSAEDHDDPEVFAMTIVASAIMNLDAALTK